MSMLCETIGLGADLKRSRFNDDIDPLEVELLLSKAFLEVSLKLK
jgi:hypothetical protein